VLKELFVERVCGWSLHTDCLPTRPERIPCCSYLHREAHERALNFAKSSNS
jgi:hypothetical protein